MKYTQVILGVGTTLLAGVLYASPAFAETSPVCSILPQSICDSSIKSDTSDVSKSGIFQVLIWVLRIMTGAVGIVAVGALIYAGIIYSSASGDSGQVGKAKTIINDTVIGLVTYGLMFLILNWLIPGGVFGS